MRKQQGKQIGRSPISANLKNQIIKLRKDGMGMNKIAKTLSVGNSQVLRICTEIAA